MAKINLDFTGTRGLMNHYFGDKPFTASKHNLRYLGEDGSIAEGVYNPFTFYGYLSPANNTTKTVTGTTSFLLTSVLTVPYRLATASTDAIFFADEATTGTQGKILNLDTAIDTALDTTLTLSGITNSDSLFSISFSGTEDYIINGIKVNPTGSTMPTIIHSDRATSATGTSITKSTSVPAGTNKVMLVAVFNNTDPRVNPTGVTWDGNAMTLVDTYDYGMTGLDASFALYRYLSPATTTGNVVATYAGTTTHMVMHIIVTDNTDQTTPVGTLVEDAATLGSVGTVSITVDQSGGNELRLCWLYSTTSTHTAVNDFMTQVLNSSNTIGTDSLWSVSLGSKFYRSEDFAIYSVNGVPKIFYTRMNTTDSTVYYNTIGIADLDFANNNDDWSFEEHAMYLSGATRPVFVLADNNFLYVLDGNSVHSIDGSELGGTNATIRQNVLLFLGDINTNVVTRLIDGTDIKGKIWIGLHVHPNFSTRDSSVNALTIPQFIGVYLWDRQSTVAGMQDFIRIDGAKEFKSIHSLHNEPVCFTVSTEGYTQLRKFNGYTFQVVKTLGKNSFPNYRKHSVYEDEESIKWLGNDGKVYVYGKFEGNDSDELYIIGDMTSHVTNGQTYSQSGVFTAANATETVTTGNEVAPLAFYLSFSDTAGNHLKKWYPYSYNTVASVEQKPHQGNVYSKVYYLPYLSDLKNLIVYCAPGATSSSTQVATLKLYFNQSTTAGMEKNITKADVAKGYISIDINKSFVNAIQVEVEWTAAETLSTDTFLPSIGILDFEQTKAHSPSLSA